MFFERLHDTDGQWKGDDFIDGLENDLPEHQPRELGRRNYSPESKREEYEAVAALSSDSAQNCTERKALRSIVDLHFAHDESVGERTYDKGHK